MVVDGDECSFRILGPVQVVANGSPLRFARRQQLDLVAFLLLHAEHVVTTGQIIDAMWGEAAPRTAGIQVKNMLSALRGGLHASGQPLATVDRQPAGYRLHIVSGQLDLTVFTARVAAARVARSPSETVRLLRSALGLWQGTIPLAGVRAVFADAARTHLKEQHDTALEEMFDAELACGDHAAIVAALTDAVADNPGRERLVGQLMLALYRSGRATDALGVYQRARRTLAEEFGLEPGPALRDLERRILRADPMLEPERTAPARPRAAPAAPERDRPEQQTATRIRPARPLTIPVPAQLPLEVRGFAGRGAELAALNTLITDVIEKPTAMVIIALMGTAGVGKTALAVHWAHRIADRFPDGQLYVNLRGFDPSAPAMNPADAIRGFLDAFAVPPDQIPASLDGQAALYRSLVAGRRVLVVLDNALDTEQVRPLLPGTAGCLVLITSRNRLSGLVAVEGAVPVTLDVLTEIEVREFLLGRLGAERVVAEAQAVEAIGEHCARLPLALALVAARAAIHPRFPLATLSAELSAARDRLSALAVGDSGDDVRTAFSWSYHRLASDAATLFRLLGLYPGPDLVEGAAASLAGTPVPAVRPLLAELARTHLVTEHLPGRFALHDLLRAYAAELGRTVDTAARRRRAVHRLLDHYLRTAYHAALLIYPHRYQLELAAPVPGAYPIELADAAAASAWFAAEHAGLIAALDLAADAGLGTHAWQLASAMATYFHRRGHWHDWADTQCVALAAAERASDRAGQAHAHGSLGLAFERLHRYDEAHLHLRRALALLGELDDAIGQAYMYLRMSGVYEGQGHYATALRHAEQARDLFRAEGHQAGHAQALNTVGWLHAQLGQYADAIDHCGQAILLHRELGDRQGVAHTLDSLGFAHHHLGHYDQAVAHFQEALDVLRQGGDRYYESIALTHLGDSHRAGGDVAAARDAWRRAVEILDELGHPDAESLHDRLIRLDDPPRTG